MVIPAPSDFDIVYKKYGTFPKDKDIKRFDYYDTPADQQGLEKLLYCTKMGAKAGFFVGAADVCLVSYVTDFVPVAGRFAYWMIPFVTAGGAFMASNYALAKVRKRDAPLNHIISSYVAGSVFGAKWNSIRAGAAVGTFFAAFAVVKKYYMDHYPEDSEVLKVPKNPYYNFTPTMKYKWSLVSPGQDEKLDG